MDAIVNFLQQTGFYIVQQNPLSLVMLVVSCVLLYLAIVKQFEPLLLLPIALRQRACAVGAVWRRHSHPGNHR